MNIYHIIRFILRYLQVLSIFPYTWKTFKDLKFSIKQQIGLNDSYISAEFKKSFQIDPNLPVIFKFDKISGTFSTLWFMFLNLFSIYIFYGNSYIEDKNDSIYNYTVPLFCGVINSCFVFTLVFIKIKSKILLEIFKNLNETHFPNSSLNNIYKSIWFYRLIILIFGFLMYVSNQLYCFYYDIKTGMDFFFPSEIFYYLYNALINFSVVLTLEIISFLYSSIFDFQYFKTKFVRTKTVWNDKQNKHSIKLINKTTYEQKTLKSELEYLILKFYINNQHQKILNSFFGPLITSILIQNIAYIIFVMYLFIINISQNISFITLFKSIRILDSVVKIFIIFTSTSIINYKVRFQYLEAFEPK